MDLLTPPPYYLLAVLGVLAICAILFAVFFYRSVKTPGVGKLSRFTRFITITGSIVYLLRFLPYIPDLTDLLPLRDDTIILAMVFGFSLSELFFFMLFLIVSVLLLQERWAHNTSLLKTVWIVFAMFNLAVVMIHLHSCLSWTPPVITSPGTRPEDLILEHIRNVRRVDYLLYSIYPATWCVVSAFAMLKLYRSFDTEAKIIPKV